MQEHLNAGIENPISPMMWVQMNAAYKVDNGNNITHFRETFKGAKEEPTDKVYFRRKDEVSEFAECMFQSKVLMTKK